PRPTLHRHLTRCFPFHPTCLWRPSMNRAPVGRAMAALAVVAISLFVAFTMSPRLGLDLRGGTQLVFETKDSPTVKTSAEATDRTVEVLRRRADALGVAEPLLARSGERRII